MPSGIAHELDFPILPAGRDHGGRRREDASAPPDVLDVSERHEESEEGDQRATDEERNHPDEGTRVGTLAVVRLAVDGDLGRSSIGTP